MPKGIWEVFKEFGIALGTDIAFKKFTSTAADKAAGHVAEKVFADKRAELLGDLLAMPAEDTNNLWRRHRKATAIQLENRFVALLVKVPQENRQEVLVALNRMSDSDFEQAMNLLDHDVIPQFVHRQASRAAKTGRKAAAGIDHAAEKATPKINDLNKKLRKAVQRAKTEAQGGP